MGLEQGPIYRELAEGRDVTMPNGTVIRSAEVSSSSRRLLWQLDSRLCGRW